MGVGIIHIHFRFVARDLLLKYENEILLLVQNENTRTSLARGEANGLSKTTVKTEN